MLPWFFRHYAPLCERIFIYDNGSDDGSQELVRAQPKCELRTIDTGRSTEEMLVQVKGQAWKESRGLADWVICCDVDEFLDHPDLPRFLADSAREGISLPVPTGIQMVSEEFPEAAQTAGALKDVLRSGFPDRHYDKFCLFDPSAIDDIGYTAGCHVARPSGRLRLRRDPHLRLLHFKLLGPRYVTERYAALRARQRAADRATGAAYQYTWTEAEIQERFELFRSRAQPLF